MMDSSYASSTLRISLDDTSERLETVAAMTVNDTNTSRVEAVRPDRTPIFPDPSRGHRYMMDFTANRSLAGNGPMGSGTAGGSGSSSDPLDTQREISRMQLVWNGKSNYRKVIFLYKMYYLLANVNARPFVCVQMFTFEYVEPYSNGSCHLYTNCMQCLSDALCGWCEPSRRCLSRMAEFNATEPPECFLTVDGVETQTPTLLTLSPQLCINCSDHIACDRCVADISCEWLVEDASCTRRGR